MKYNILKRILFASLVMLLARFVFRTEQVTLGYTPEESINPSKYDVA